MAYPIVVNEESVRAYSPADPAGTTNRRLICAATVGAQQLEVLLGTIAPREDVRAHSHPFLERASYILVDEGLGPFWTIVVYAPPQNENPAQTSMNAGFDPATAPVCIAVNGDAPHFAPAGYLATHARSLINDTVDGAKYMEAFDLLIDAGGGKPDDLASKAEQTVHVKRGQLRGEVDGQAFSAVMGDWVFVPASARWTMQACGPGHVQALLLRAADFERDAAERLTAFVRLSP